MRFFHLPPRLAALLTIGLCLVSYLVFAQRRGRSFAPAPLAGNPEAIAAGHKLFTSACGGCHGLTGEGARGPNLADGRIVRRSGPDTLFNAVKHGVQGSDMPPFNLPDEKIWQVLAYIASLSAPAIQNPPAGDVEAGRALFFGKAGCGDCHAIRGHGGFLGPDLSAAGEAHSVKQIREALLDPTSRSNEHYRGVTVVTRRGEKITGVARNHTNYSLQIIDAKGDLHLLSMDDVRTVAWRDGSIMPGDYAKRLTPAEIDNLLAYLSRQSVRPFSPRTAMANPVGMRNPQ
ncbi:MAG: c-type cytochrome [Bryobacteraceae bacterium]